MNWKNYTCCKCGKTLIDLTIGRFDESDDYHEYWCDKCGISFEISLGISFDEEEDKNTTAARVATLQRMDSIMRNLDDEEYIMWWLEVGVPDGEDEWEWLTDDNYYSDIVDAYHRIIRAYTEEYPNELSEEQINIG